MHPIGLSLAVHTLPFWFLVLSLFLPRISLLVMWWESQKAPFYAVGLLPLVAAILVPRILILFMIYNDTGISGWFLLHAVALVLAWGGFGSTQMRRYRDD